MGTRDDPRFFALYFNVRDSEVDLGIVCYAPNAGSWCAFGHNTQVRTMIGADVVIGYVDENGVPYAEDFKLFDKLPPSKPCRNAVCPDRTQVGCKNNAVLRTGSRVDDYLVIEYTRPINASDACDLTLPIDEEVYPVIAQGSTNPEESWPFNILQHDYRMKASEDEGEETTSITFASETTAESTPDVTSESGGEIVGETTEDDVAFGSRSTDWIFVGSAAAGLFICVGIIAFLFLRVREKKKEKNQQYWGIGYD